MISQAWVQVAGLVIDFFGFALIAWEWLIAQKADSAQRAIEARHARDMELSRLMQRNQQAMNPHANPQMSRSHEIFDEMRTRSAERQVEQTRAAFASMRKSVVFTGMFLVFLGFALQVMGTIPGCCRLIGIVSGAN